MQMRSLNNLCSQGILLNDDFRLDWVFKNSIILDIVMVRYFALPIKFRHVIGGKKISDTFFRSTIFPSYGSGDAVSPLAGSGAEPRKQTHIGNNLLKIVVLLYNFIIIYLYNIGAQNSWFFLEVT